MKRQLTLIGAALTLSSCTMLTGPTTQDVTVIGVNDLHGNLLPTSFRVPDPADRTKTLTVQAGGVEAIGTVLARARAANPNTVFVGVGDMTGASPLISALLRDEPTILALNGLGMQVNVLGNHEFDYGIKELQRYQRGGCDSNAPEIACKFDPTFKGAAFNYIAANVFDSTTGQRVFPAYKIVKSGNARIAFVGAVLKDTPSVVTPSGVAGLRFEDEVASINRVMPEIRRQRPDAIIALVHQGGASRDTFDTINCKTLTGDIVKIAQGIDPAVGAIMTGHTHRGYNCAVAGPTGVERPVIQGDAYGHLLQRLDLTVDTRLHRLVSIKASNVVVDAKELPKDAAMTALVQKAKGMTDPLAQRVVATLGVEQITRTAAPNGESALGRLIADSQLAATSAAAKGGAVVAFMNPGGIRADLPVNVPNPNRTVTYGDVFAVQPFGNILQVITLTGAQIKAALEQQFDNPAAGQNRMLQVSKGFTYTWDNAKPKGEKVSDIRLNGQPLDMNAKYRVALNSFLADGGDNFTTFAQGTDRLGGDLDLDAFQNFLKASPASPDTTERVKRLN
ncbi:multifunctional 2',3'-cyclic-nucleotide 2'-phosphodiesterase/5'-nucleotidase/3'-nucleotidase [Deinococcus malanensis]|uniref:Multifunctional 2',3'-cyclic-nucleotide 2'-phosphodiesterase/5'-nucleotidase/3'-nucleotidase n=1 Tax=Deinococcus malanensis TaxID=1706855 RepID=A0ABQ2EJH4_9DEIO|nr:bifunctional metallophosphatase/5'-nucleotidase [Deinococcus malanensis]GGK14499.1 multifunctional 2',3'-cyclic-nucleotide 2'-phosphodiesterase/5'-nucleotidase/3'-nucleotidase [Deinococcus malanensis]